LDFSFKSSLIVMILAERRLSSHARHVDELLVRAFPISRGSARFFRRKGPSFQMPPHHRDQLRQPSSVEIILCVPDLFFLIVHLWPAENDDLAPGDDLASPAELFPASEDACAYPEGPMSGGCFKIGQRFLLVTAHPQLKASSRETRIDITKRGLVSTMRNWEMNSGIFKPLKVLN